uniref:DNA-directed RNA polymerase III subunit Rpc5 n=1 Tax=Fagus sylvatica TaxID=28930 RepID=A0A2N9EFG6_FAGSY
MDLDDLDGPSKPQPRTSRFAPKSLKPKPKPKSEPVSKPEPQGTVPKPEPQQLDASTPKKKEEEAKQEAIAAKDEAEASNGAVKMDIDDKPEAARESMENDTMDEDTGEDVVVREIDVFFNPPMEDDTKLYVLQYPLRPCWRPYNLDDQCEEVRVKSVSAEMEVDLTVDVDSKHFDQDFCERLHMNKQTLSSSWKVPLKTGYAVGVLMGNKLHLNAIHAVVQLRPSLEHLSSGGSKRKNNVVGDAEVSVKLEESAGEKSSGPSKKQNKRMESSTEKSTDDEEV